MCPVAANAAACAPVNVTVPVMVSVPTGNTATPLPALLGTMGQVIVLPDAGVMSPVSVFTLALPSVRFIAVPMKSLATIAPPVGTSAPQWAPLLGTQPQGHD